MKKQINKQYIEWLEKFTIKNPSFSNQDWIYGFESLNDNDRANIQSFHLFCEQVEQYAINNNLNVDKTKMGTFYNLRTNNADFRICSIEGKHKLYFCNRVNFDKDYNIINCNDVLNDDLNKLSNDIVKLYEKGVSIQDISDTCQNTVEKIKIKALKKTL